MTRVILAAVALTAFSLHSAGEEPAVQFNVRPMPAPKPAFKYQLLPEVGEINPGNPAQNYLKCFMEQRNFFYGREAVADRARFESMPLAELPADTLRQYGGSALRQADWAARLDTIDWQSQRVQNGSLGLVPAELGPLQLLAAALHVRFRGEVAGKRYNDAIRSAKTMFALSRHLGEHSTVVANLVGLWVAHLCLVTLEEMVQQPGCPNLYWALTDLPSPLVELRKGVQGDRAQVVAELRLLRDDAVMTEPEMEKFVSRLTGLMSFAREQAGHAPRNIRTGLQARAKDPEKVRAARRRLIESGCPVLQVLRFSNLQVILLDEKRAFEIQRDDRMKLIALPLWRIDCSTAVKGREGGGDDLFADLLPQIIKLRQTQGGLERQIALLRQVEALRLYAAEHDGKLPNELTAVSVPAPIDPFTGKPFVYRVEGATAQMSASIPGGEVKDADYNVRYKVTIQK